MDAFDEDIVKALIIPEDKQRRGSIIEGIHMLPKILDQMKKEQTRRNSTLLPIGVGGSGIAALSAFQEKAKKPEPSSAEPDPRQSTKEIAKPQIKMESDEESSEYSSSDDESSDQETPKQEQKPEVAEPVKVEPIKVEPVKVEPVKVELKTPLKEISPNIVSKGDAPLPKAAPKTGELIYNKTI